ncbi:NAF1-domain-containing protein [Artomyces pyxidatus]|uniref:NAF1-domain-containing protein n=1 Tax=Artomyces pyxidatus TaxID=48021 RepID=A0ACB8SSY6_9AGAM|nr:NAF1-domain-containing protein [Artomyces pyxidatus]
MDDSGFKVPTILPQDLLLIQDIVAETFKPLAAPTPVPATLPVSDDDSIASTGDEEDSEDEVEAGILLDTEENEPSAVAHGEPSDSSSESSSESEAEDDTPAASRSRTLPQEGDEDEDEEGGVTSSAVLKTKNELDEGVVVVPDITEIGPEEHLEKVGEIMSIVNNVVIVKGAASGYQQRASEKALDSETLLFFEDRTVFGYIYETFGPTYQPLYQVRFNQAYPLDLEKVRVSREVFHAPQRSNFVFLSELQRQRGSDASNVHDEEPAEFELEFSDDEAEAAHKSKLRQRRQGSREPSVVASSRHATPTPSQMRDQDMSADVLYGTNPYEAHGVYDVNPGAGPSRPPPVPYDDPYSDEYNMGEASMQIEIPGPSSTPAASSESWSPHSPTTSDSGRGRGRGRGRGNMRGSRDNDGGRGRRQERGRGRGRGRDRGRGHAGTGGQRYPPSGTDEYGSHTARSLSPTSQAIANATGHVPSEAGFSMPSVSPDSAVGYGGQWAFGQGQGQFAPHFGGGMPSQQFVQPHINPRFASAFGFDMGYMQPQQQAYPMYGQYGAGGRGYGSSEWTGDWNASDGSGGRGQYGHGQAGGA